MKSTIKIPDDISAYLLEADEHWDLNQNEEEFASYVSADYDEVFRSLVELKDRAYTFLELGSGLGAVTIMASRLGYEAYGIEASAGLVDYARDSAATLAPDAKFGVGSFIPYQFEWDPGSSDEAIRTFIDLPDAYGEIDMTLADFDLIYAYPWPTEHPLYHNFLGQFARKGSLFLAYDAREGMLLRSI